MKNEPEKPEGMLPYSGPLTPEQEDKEKAYHAAIGARAQNIIEQAAIAEELKPIAARRLQIPADRDTYAQKRLQAQAGGQDPRPWAQKEAGLITEAQELDRKQEAIEARLRESRELAHFIKQEVDRTGRELCAVRLTGLSDELNDLILAIHPRLLEVEAIYRYLGMSVAPIVPHGNLRTLPSAKYPQILTLERK